MPETEAGASRREINRRARQAVLENVLPGDAEPTSRVSYVSHGRLLVIGD